MREFEIEKKEYWTIYNSCDRWLYCLSLSVLSSQVERSSVKRFVQMHVWRRTIGASDKGTCARVQL